MRGFRFEERIEGSPAEVWAALMDLAAAPRWRPLIRSMETEDGAPVRVGQRIRVVVELMGNAVVRSSETVALEPERRWTVRSAHEGMEGVFEFRLDPTAGGTMVVHQFDVRTSRLTRIPLLPLIALSERRLRRPLLPNLRRYVESHSAARIGAD